MGHTPPLYKVFSFEINSTPYFLSTACLLSYMVAQSAEALACDPC